ncbi:hypothetical protein [Desulfosoma caldarium]|uniref:Uncharacterized protein n=1 Tax=Desulfosoma caldarium TaxID=610254 RepID=A0A3N1UTP8_9BACT|nr:hypothetical protein [Desulfosoma caldarium]ROQ91221.1 hypothetical protein EDC27_2507 [Desulfosoma caldarium]
MLEWHAHLSLPVVALAVGVNVPFGYWRAHVQRFSRAWFLAIHLPVPLVVALRLVSGQGWRLASIAVFVGAFCLGQWLGGMAYRVFKKGRRL